MSAQDFRPGQIIRARGESWVVHRYVAGSHGSLLDVSGRGAGNRGTRASFLLPYEPIERLPSSEAPRMVRPGTWRRSARGILAVATPSYDALRSAARASVAMLPFQLEPVLAIVRGLAARVLVADEVGLGKTIQAGLVISEVLERRPDARVLVVTPAGLREQWQTELHERFSLDSTLLDSSIARHATGLSGNPWSMPGVVLTSLDYVKRPEVVRALESLIWDVMVFDEAHALAGHSHRAVVAAALARRARTLVLLTATPHSGNEEAFGRLTSLGDFPPSHSRTVAPSHSRTLAPGSSRFPLLVFRRTRSDVGVSSSRRTLSLRVRPNAEESAMHAALMDYARLVWRQSHATAPAARLAMTVLTRRACSSAWSFARSVDARLRLLGACDEPDVFQIALPFDDAVADDRAPASELSSPGLLDRHEERRWLDRLLQLARLAEPAQSKLLALRRFLRRAGERAIVFTEYRDTLHQLAHALDDFAPALLHGGMTAGERREILRRFVTGRANLLLATDAASEGLNLHHTCRLVINLELPWTPVRLEQRVGRVERLGQQRRVHAVHLLAAGTCEEESVAALLTRMRRVAGVLGGMRAAAHEEQIAAVAIGGAAETDAPPVPFPAGIVIGDLRAAATEEAARLEQVRSLIQDGRHDTIESRPCVAVFNSRPTRPVNDWIYHLVFEGPDLHALWTTAIGIRDRTRLSAPTSAAIRQRLDLLTGIVEPALTPVARQLLSLFLSSFGGPRRLAIERERAIAAALGQQRARLATSLLQPGLFDRRAERAAAAQNATLDEALDRCARRLDELGRLEPISVDRRLACGVIRR